MATKKTVKKAAKPTAKKHYIVTYDIDDEDPVQVFDSLEKAKAFATAIMTNDYQAFDAFDSNNDVDDITKSSVKVYEAVLIGKPKVEISFTK